MMVEHVILLDREAINIIHETTQSRVHISVGRSNAKSWRSMYYAPIKLCLINMIQIHNFVGSLYSLIFKYTFIELLKCSIPWSTMERKLYTTASLIQILQGWFFSLTLIIQIDILLLIAIVSYIYYNLKVLTKRHVNLQPF